uniref:Coiled-coil domain-containing protein 25 n=1 Tax=Meloidogyne floridensis TaxID=298350 RepID=A0A915PD41_9BILA
MASSLRLTGTALRELRIHLCQKSPESNGVRQFIENDYVDLKKGNRYEYGIEKSISVENESREKLSSAHVYLRLQTGQQISDISEDLIEDCCQLVKANSIEGCKLSETDVVYTMWSNLKKTGDMVTGQVGFHKNKDVKKVRVQKQREIINRLNKTKTHATGVDFRQLREQRDMEERQKVKEKQKQFLNEEKAKREAIERESKNMSYDRVFTPEQMSTTNKNTEGRDLEEDFM